MDFKAFLHIKKEIKKIKNTSCIHNIMIDLNKK